MLAVEHQLTGVLRLIELADLRENSQLAKHSFHAEGAGFVGDNRYDADAELRIANQLGENADEGHGARDLAILAALELRLEDRQWRHFERFRLAPALRQASAQSGAPFAQISHLDAVFGGPIEGHLRDLIVVDGNLEAITKRLQLFDSHLFLLMSDVHALAGRSHPVTLDGLG